VARGGEMNVGFSSNEGVPWLRDVSPQELRRILDVTHRVHGLLAVITDLDTLLDRVMQECKAVASAEACSLMLYDPQSQGLHFHVALGEKGDQQRLKQQIRLQVGQGVAGMAAALRKPINVEDVKRSQLWYWPADEVTQFQTRAVLAVPLLDRDQLIGVVEVLNKQDGGPFTEADLHVMEIFSSVVATAIANARLIEEKRRAERLAAIGEAVASLSHYAKNVLTGISGSVQMIDEALQDHDSQTLEQTWPILKRCVARLTHFVGDMLAFCKPRVPLKEQSTVEEVVAEAVEALHSLMARKKIDIELNLGGVKGPFSLERPGIFRCLLNLLLNAAEAVAHEDGRIWVSAWNTPEGALHLEVADNGPGIPEEDVDKVCDPFFSTKGAYGTGLGLAVTSKIVREHGGQLQIGRREGGGATMKIMLPPHVRPE